MKPERKIINMDYRGQTAKTAGMFAEFHWPRNDEVVDSNYYREEMRAAYKKQQVAIDGEPSKYDRDDRNKKIMYQGRAQW